MFVEQPLASPRSAKEVEIKPSSHSHIYISSFIGLTQIIFGLQYSAYLMFFVYCCILPLDKLEWVLGTKISSLPSGTWCKICIKRKVLLSEIHNAWNVLRSQFINYSLNENFVFKINWFDLLLRKVSGFRRCDKVLTIYKDIVWIIHYIKKSNIL